MNIRQSGKRAFIEFRDKILICGAEMKRRANAVNMLIGCVVVCALLVCRVDTKVFVINFSLRQRVSD